MYKNEELFQLIPQRSPIVMIDALWSVRDDGAETGLSVKPDNIFVLDGFLREPGLIEHVAQSAAAFSGYSTHTKGLPPRLGYIGEVKKCEIHKLPRTGEHLRTQLQVLGEAAGITLMSASSYILQGEQDIIENGTTPAMECLIKIFLKD